MQQAQQEVALLQQCTKAKRFTTLLGVAWVTDQSIQNFSKFPEVISGDTTHKVNNCWMPLHTFVGKNSENSTFQIMWVFMASEQQ